MQIIAGKILTEIFYAIERQYRRIHVLFKFDKGYLYFNPCRFLYTDEAPVLSKALKWHGISYNKLNDGVYITSIKEDEFTSYFLTLSNNDIFFIHQSIDGEGIWMDRYEITAPADVAQYAEVQEYMNEEFVEEANIIDDRPKT